MKQSETKNFKSQNNDEVSLNYRLAITHRHTMVLPSFLGNVIFMLIPTEVDINIYSYAEN